MEDFKSEFDRLIKQLTNYNYYFHNNANPEQNNRFEIKLVKRVKSPSLTNSIYKEQEIVIDFKTDYYDTFDLFKEIENYINKKHQYIVLGIKIIKNEGIEKNKLLQKGK